MITFSLLVRFRLVRVCVRARVGGYYLTENIVYCRTDNFKFGRR